MTNSRSAVRFRRCAAPLVLLVLSVSATAGSPQVSPRQVEGDFAVSVSGGEFIAGTYHVPPAFRVLDVLRSATDTLRLDRLPREILVDGAPVDILRFVCCQQLDQNPLVRPGMTVSVPFAVRFAEVLGEARGAAGPVFALARGETIESALALFTLSALADSASVVLVRAGEHRTVARGEFAAVALEHGDRIVVPARRALVSAALVEVRGEVLRPGFFVITPGTTCVRDVLDSAGIAPGGDTTMVRVYRRMRDTSLAASPRPEVAAAIRNAFETGDFATICGAAGDRLLSDSDLVVVPPAGRTVSVSGYVRRPGAYDFQPGASRRSYVRRAGGYTPAADRTNVRVLSQCGETYQLRDTREIRPGDVILVPENQEAKWVRTWLPVLQVVASTLTIVVALINLSR